MTADATCRSSGRRSSSARRTGDALDDLCQRQEKIEQALYCRYLRQQKTPPRLFLHDVTSSYLEGEHNELGAFGYNRDGKHGKLQIGIGLLTDDRENRSTRNWL